MFEENCENHFLFYTRNYFVCVCVVCCLHLMHNQMHQEYYVNAEMCISICVCVNLLALVSVFSIYTVQQCNNTLSIEMLRFSFPHFSLLLFITYYTYYTRFCCCCYCSFAAITVHAHKNAFCNNFNNNNNIIIPNTLSII